MNQHRILMATDVPFWRKSTGAEQRIASMVHFLMSDSFQVRTFFLGQTDSDQFTTNDQKLIKQQNLDIDQRSSEQLPRQLSQKLGWYADATVNQIKQWTQGNKEHAPADTAMRLEDFRWPWAMKAFSESVSEFQPDSILIQYIKLGYLLNSLTESQRMQTSCIVDTHDILHKRAEQFREHGFQHWINIDREEESNALQQFDLILAIQENEARLIREMAPQSQTIVCGHATVSTISKTKFEPDPSGVEGALTSIGYLGSTNASNTAALESFFKTDWSKIRSPEKSKLEFVIAGSICNWIEKNTSIDLAKLDCVRLLGPVEELEEFYNQVDVVINPVEFGTGLKIKNCEAIAFGKPLLTTTHGAIGLPPESKNAMIVCQSTESLVAAIQNLMDDVQRFRNLVQAAKQLSQTGFSDQEVYSELKQTLLQEK